jgi:hypothetical protein
MDIGGALLVVDDEDDGGVMIGTTGGTSPAVEVAVVVTVAAAFDAFNDLTMETSRSVDEMDTKTHVTTISKTNGLEKSRQF